MSSSNPSVLSNRSAANQPFCSLCAARQIPIIFNGNASRAPAIATLIKGSFKSYMAIPLLIGAPGWIRTSDLELRSLLLYPTELPGHWCGIPESNWSLEFGKLTY